MSIQIVSVVLDITCLHSQQAKNSTIEMNHAVSVELTSTTRASTARLITTQLFPAALTRPRTPTTMALMESYSIVMVQSNLLRLNFKTACVWRDTGATALPALTIASLALMESSTHLTNSLESSQMCLQDVTEIKHILKAIAVRAPATPRVS